MKQNQKNNTATTSIAQSSQSLD